MIQLQDVKKQYDTDGLAVWALKGINADIGAGEFCAIMGRSGSGKSTLLNILGLMDRPTSGHYFLDSEDVAQLSDDRLSELRNRQIGFVFQSFHLLPRLSALDNVLLPLRFSTSPPADPLAAAKQLLDRVGLADRAGHRPNEMSGGQRQRVAIARALINNPKVLLADEPTGNLDTSTADQIIDLFKELNAEGQTIVLVTHEPDVAAHADRQIVLLDGLVMEAQHAA